MFADEKFVPSDKQQSKNSLDRWILAKLHELNKLHNKDQLSKLLKTNYIHTYYRKKLLYLSLKPILCYIISIEHQHS